MPTFISLIQNLLSFATHVTHDSSHKILSVPKGYEIHEPIAEVSCVLQSNVFGGRLSTLRTVKETLRVREMAYQTK